MKCSRISLNDVDAIPDRVGEIRILISPRSSDSKEVVLGHSTLKSGETLTRHIHDYSDEIFYVLQGNGVLKTSEQTIEFKAFDAVHIPKKTEHCITNTGTEEMSVIFCVSPLAPSPELGHRELT